MDVSPNPGPDFTWTETESRQACQTNSQSFQQYASQQYYGLSEGRNRLLYLRKFCWKPSTCVMAKLKSMGILKYRSRRRGKNITFPKPTQSNYTQQPLKNIEVVNSRRAPKPHCNLPIQRYLVSIPCVSEKVKEIKPIRTKFAVPKSLFINICSLMKTKNRVRAVVALEADLNNHDIDLCVVTETHLQPEMPDAVVNIPTYTIFRRDRNWSGQDKRKKERRCGYLYKK